MILETQTISFRGVYELIGDPPIFTPKALDWVQMEYLYTYMPVVPGKTICFVHNMDATRNFYVSPQADRRVVEPPDYLLWPQPAVLIPPQSINVIGPLTEAFANPEGNCYLQVTTGGIPESSIMIAAILLPD